MSSNFGRGVQLFFMNNPAGNIVKTPLAQIQKWVQQKFNAGRPLLTYSADPPATLESPHERSPTALPPI